MSNAIPSTPLVYRDDVKFPLPAPYHAVLTVQDCQEIAELFVGTTRNPNHCISKGQYAKLTEQLAARNKMLEKRIRQAVRPFTYLAGPYSHDDAAVRQARFEALNKAAAVLMAQGHIVFSPISHTHPIAEAADLPKGWDYWEQFDRGYLACSHTIIVLKLDGWDRSTGVAAELEIAKELALVVQYMEPA